MGVPDLLHDVALKRFTESFCNTFTRCGASCRRCSEPCPSRTCNICNTLSRSRRRTHPLLPAHSVRMRPTPVLYPERTGAGRPITGEWCPARSSVSWTTTCGSSPGGGPSAPTAGSRSGGSPTATSASSTSSGTTAGYSGTGPAPMSAAASRTWSSSPGLPLSGTRWSQERPHPMIRTWPATGPPGGSGSNPRWTATTCACSPGRTGAVRSAVTRCSPPTSPSPPRSGNAGG
jgi:hypothetical protein